MACVVCHAIYSPSKDNPVDSDEKPHQCTICGLSFTFKIQLKRHSILHTDGAPYTCKYCVKENEDKGKTYNLRLGNKSEYSCEVCHENFSNKRLLLRHSIQHTYESDDGCEENIKITIKKRLTSPSSKNLSKNSSEREPLKISLKKHWSATASKTKNLVCEACNKSFAYQACLDKHIKMGKCSLVSSSKLSPKHSGSGSRKTKEALRDSKTIEYEKNPSDNSNQTDIKKHVCSVCGKTFARKSSLDGHELSHILNKETSEDEKYFSDSDVSDEPEPKKPKTSTFRFQKSYMCDKCNFVCFSKQTLDKHLTNHQIKGLQPSEIGEDIKKIKENSESSKEDPSNSLESFKDSETEVADVSFKCENCDKRFKSKSKLLKHNCGYAKKAKNTEETRKSVCECTICGEEFYLKRHLKNHLLSHAEYNADDSSMDKKDIFKHRTKRSKNFACEICGRRFAGEICFKKHQLKHEEDAISNEAGTTPTSASSATRVKKIKSGKELICEYCNEDFTGKRSSYIKHIHGHTPEVCGICDERFVDRQSLREHCKIHVGTEEGKMFMQCSQKALDAKNGVVAPEPKVEYIYLVLR